MGYLVIEFFCVSIVVGFLIDIILLFGVLMGFYFVLFVR